MSIISYIGSDLLDFRKYYGRRLTMGRIFTFKSKYLSDGHLSVPKEMVNSLLLREGEEVRVMIEREEFDKEAFLALFGIWKEKTEEEIGIYREILKEREIFGRGEVEF
jgi:predicted DNA-binding antitoxin AbrB/MazE fold protein